MKIKSVILSTLFVSGFLITACSETPEEKVRREVRESCENVKKLAPPRADPAQLQKMIEQCVEKETSRKLQQLNQPPHN